MILSILQGRDPFDEISFKKLDFEMFSPSSTVHIFFLIFFHLRFLIVFAPNISKLLLFSFFQAFQSFLDYLVRFLPFFFFSYISHFS